MNTKIIPLAVGAVNAYLVQQEGTILIDTGQFDAAGRFPGLLRKHGIDHPYPPAKVDVVLNEAPFSLAPYTRLGQRGAEHW